MECNLLEKISAHKLNPDSYYAGACIIINIFCEMKHIDLINILFMYK